MTVHHKDHMILVQVKGRMTRVKEDQNTFTYHMSRQPQVLGHLTTISYLMNQPLARDHLVTVKCHTTQALARGHMTITKYLVITWHVIGLPQRGLTTTSLSQVTIVRFKGPMSVRYCHLVRVNYHVNNLKLHVTNI